MKTKQIIALTSIALALGASFSANAFGLGNMLPKTEATGGASSANSENDIADFLKTADEAYLLTSQSAFILGKALLTKQEMQAAEDALAAANKLQDVKERDAAKAKVQQDLNAQLAKVDFDAKSQALAKEQDKKKKALVGASMHNFVLGLLKDVDLIQKATEIASAVGANPMMATKLLKVKDVSTSLSGQMDNMRQIASGLQKLNAVIKTAPLPTSSSAAPVSIAD